MRETESLAFKKSMSVCRGRDTNADKNVSQFAIGFRSQAYDEAKHTPNNRKRSTKSEFRIFRSQIDLRSASPASGIDQKRTKKKVLGTARNKQSLNVLSQYVVGGK